MVPAYADLFTLLQHLTPTWRKTQQQNLALLVQALLTRPTLCLAELARAYPSAHPVVPQPLHGRLKRLTRFLDNPRLDELTLAGRWLRLTYQFGAHLPDPAAQLVLPIVLDTTSFEPFAALIAAVPCGSRALPVALATYHRTTRATCLPPREHWPDPLLTRAPRRGETRPPASSAPRVFPSQNRIEEDLIDLVWHLLSPGIQGVLVADRGFARASLFRWLRTRQRAFVIRIDADTHVRLDPAGASQRVDAALPVRPGEHRWVTGATYHQEEQIPVNLLAVWEPGQQEPWYLATTLDQAEATETLYRWRMRLECTNRDEKTGVLLRQGGDAHALTAIHHLHRLLLALCAADWVCALVGLQAHRDLAAPETVDPALATAPPTGPEELLARGPALPPEVIPHRGPRPPLPLWVRPFAVRGSLSYIRLGWEVLHAPALTGIVRRVARWLGIYLWPSTPLWRPWQRRYRLRHWWAPSG